MFKFDCSAALSKLRRTSLPSMVIAGCSPYAVAKSVRILSIILNQQLEFDTGQSWSMFSRNIGSLKADRSTNTIGRMS